MSGKKLSLAGLVALLTLLLNFQLVLAHETVTVGNYEIEYGWLNEPVILGQMNALVVNVSDTSSGERQPVKDVSALMVTISYGGQSKTLMLQPLGENTPGQFAAPILPTVPGQYTLSIGGRLGDTDINIEVEPEEVETADALQFPIIASVTDDANLSTMNSLIYLSLVIGIIALVIGMLALRKTR